MKPIQSRIDNGRLYPVSTEIEISHPKRYHIWPCNSRLFHAWRCINHTFSTEGRITCPENVKTTFYGVSTAGNGSSSPGEAVFNPPSHQTRAEKKKPLQSPKKNLNAKKNNSEIEIAYSDNRSLAEDVENSANCLRIDVYQLVAKFRPKEEKFLHAKKNFGYCSLFEDNNPVFWNWFCNLKALM